MAIRARRWPWILLTSAWAIGVCAGFVTLWRFASTPGGDTLAPTRWPADTHLARATDRAQLVVFVHPHCTCSRASMAELGHLLERVRGKVKPTVVFVRPHGAPADWDATELKPMAARLPDTTLVDDVDGVEAHRFGAATSGAALLYTTDGRLAFAGGLTATRGHEGDSFGQERIVALLTTGATDRADSPVFGCALDDQAPPKERP